MSDDATPPVRLTPDGGPLRLTPVVVLMGDNTLSRVRWTLEHETKRLETLMRGMPDEVRAGFDANGWTAEMLAWHHIISGLMDLAQFDDERGRT